MRTLKDIEEQFFGPRASRLVVYSNRICGDLLDFLVERHNGRPAREHSGISFKPDHGLRPVLVASYDHYFVRDTEPDMVRQVLADIRRRNETHCTTRLLFVDSDLQSEMFDRLKEGLRRHGRTDLPLHDNFNFFTAYRGEQLCTATFSLLRYSNPPPLVA